MGERIGTEGEERVRGYALMMRRVYSIEVRLQLTCLLFHLLITQQLLTQRWGGLYKSSVPAVFFWLTTSFIWHILPLHRLVPPIYLPLVLATCTFYRRTRRWHGIPPVSIFSRPLRNAFKSAVNALFTPSELARPLKFLTSPRIRGVVVCKIREFVLQLVYQPLYAGLGALEHGLHTFSDSSESALIISEAFITVLFVPGRPLCPMDVFKVRLSVLYPIEIDASSTNARKHGVLILLDEEGTKEEEEGERVTRRVDDKSLKDVEAGMLVKGPFRPEARTSTPRAFR